MAWRLAKSLAKLRQQVNEAYPGRSKRSDGTVGDAAHASRSSDHNPWVRDGSMGVVTALDLTHDPKSGLDSNQLARTLIVNRDPRIKFVISFGQIAAGAQGPQPWVWRRYTGANPHDHHVHISVNPEKFLYDSEVPWKLAGAGGPSESAEEFVEPPPTLRQGSKGDLVKKLQATIGAVPDGDFGPQTKVALQKFQVDHGLVGDGIAGPQTWKLIS